MRLQFFGAKVVRRGRNLGKPGAIWAKVKILHPQKHFISYGYFVGPCPAS